MCTVEDISVLRRGTRHTRIRSIADRVCYRAHTIRRGGVNTPGRQTVTGVSRTVHRRDMEEPATRRSLLYRRTLTTDMDWWRNGFLHRGAMTGREDGAMRHGSGELLEMQQRISRQTFTVDEHERTAYQYGETDDNVSAKNVYGGGEYNGLGRTTNSSTRAHVLMKTQSAHRVSARGLLPGHFARRI
jgi:hypothetical protein